MVYDFTTPSSRVAPHTVVGYTFEGAHWCPGCTYDQYTNGDFDDSEVDNSECYRPDVHGIPEGLKDCEGNEVHPIFADAEFDSAPRCNNLWCHAYIPHVTVLGGNK